MLGTVETSSYPDFSRQCIRIIETTAGLRFHDRDAAGCSLKEPAREARLI